MPGLRWAKHWKPAATQEPFAPSTTVRPTSPLPSSARRSSLKVKLPGRPATNRRFPAELIEECAPSEDGSKLMCGDWRVLDARASMREEAPDIIQKVRILTISPPIPNDTLSFSPDFPEELRGQIAEALAAFAETEAWDASIGNQDFYGWTGINPAADEEYDSVRAMIEAAGLDVGEFGRIEIGE